MPIKTIKMARGRTLSAKSDMVERTELRQIPGVGKSIAEDLIGLGVHSLQDLADQDPEKLYARLCAQQSSNIDRCVLYVFRCAVYFASNKKHDPALLKWWNWKDKKSPVAN
jgi:hypothetical protein